MNFSEIGNQNTTLSMASINDTLDICKAEEGSDFYFEAGYISIHYKNGVILSAKSPLAFFKGRLDSMRFKEISNIKKKYLELRITPESVLEIKRGSLCIKVYLYPIDNNELDLKLWDEDIHWHNCPGEFIKELFRFSEIAIQSRDSEQPAFSAIHITNDYLIAADYNFYRFARYRLSTSLPFSISLCSQDIKFILPRVKRKRLLRIAELEISNEDSKNRGLAFDFGDFRIWIPGSELKERNRCHEPERGGGLITYGWRYITDTASKILRTPCQFMATIPPESKPPFSVMKTCTDTISVKFMSGKLRFHYQDEHAEWKSKVVIKGLEIRTPIKIRVDPYWFLQAYTRHKLMGVIDYHGFKFLYFKDKRSEQILRTN